MKKLLPQIGRLAMRQEGQHVNIYYAMPETMKGALLLASCELSACALPGVKDMFLDLGRQIVGEIIFQEAGVRPEWGSAGPAPEHERAGSA